MSLTVFTRYLYELSDVKVLLLTSILRKKMPDALFWAHEIFISGFVDDFVHLIWTIYYDFYAQLNPNFRAYMSQKLKVVASTAERSLGIISIVENLIIRPFSTDVFMLRQIIHRFEITSDDSFAPESIALHLAEGNHEAVAHIVLIDAPQATLADLILSALNHFRAVADSTSRTSRTSRGVLSRSGVKRVAARLKLTKKIIADLKKVYRGMERVYVLSVILNMMSLFVEGIRYGKNVYIVPDASDWTDHETIDVVNPATRHQKTSQQITDPEKVLAAARMFGVADGGAMSRLFRTRWTDGNWTIDDYRLRWLYYASASPVWLRRISSFSGTVCHSSREVKFADDAQLDAFSDRFEYSPDEQSLANQMMSIGRSFGADDTLRVATWRDFWIPNRDNGVFIPDDAYLDELDNESVSYP